MVDNNRSIYRFSANDPLSWQLWPALEKRICRYSPTVAPETPVPMLLKLMREGFASGTPLIATWGLIEEDTTHELPHVTGHLIAWVESSWGQNYALVHQAHVDEYAHEFRWPMMNLLKEWIASLNSGGMNPPITYYRWLTDRARAWSAVFGDRCVYDRSVLLVKIDDESASQSEVA